MTLSLETERVSVSTKRSRRAASSTGKRRGRSARPVVEKEDVHDADAADELVHTAEEDLGRRGGADDGDGRVAGSVVDEEEHDTARAAGAGTEVLAVREDHHHPVGVREAAHIRV